MNHVESPDAFLVIGLTKTTVRVLFFSSGITFALTPEVRRIETFCVNSKLEKIIETIA
jgi:hypothetical protein